VKLYNLLLQLSVAVLDPFPVGMHLPILDAIELNIPIVSAPMLQEWTNRHVFGLLQAVGVGPSRITDFPATVEEYAVYALSLQQDEDQRKSFQRERKETVVNGPFDQREHKRKYHTDNNVHPEAPILTTSTSHGDQLLAFMEKLMYSSLM